ncbi:MAG: LCP family protein [Eubacterium sp.]
MEKESYDLEEILSEVRKRREQNQAEEKSKSAVSSTNENKIKEAPAPQKEIIKAEKASAPVEKKEPEPVFEIEAEEKPKPQAELQQEEAFTQEVKSRVAEEIKQSSADAEAEEAPAFEEAVEEKEEAPANIDSMVDLFSFSNDGETEQEYAEQEETPKFFSTKKGKITKVVIIALLILVLAAAIFAGVYIYKQLNNITEPENNKTGTEEVWSGMSELKESFPEIYETDASEIASLQDMVKTWYYNGEPCYSSHVLNVLLLGEDTRGDDILEEGTRADSAIIVSINADTGKITLTSVLRDAYAYWETEKGNSETGIAGKINGAMSRENCDVNTYINCLERLYKINIDNYVIVNFDSFKKIIDAMGGVTLELTSSEIYEINSHPKRYGDVYIEQTFEGSSGEIKLDGSQALAYCRIRKIDSDNMRADRQKTCLTQIFKQAKGESKVTLLKMVNALLPYVKTGFSTKEVVSIAKYAFSEGWLGYDVKMTSVPYARINESGMGGTNYGEWMWRPDYPQDAHYLQTLLYGKSNIILAQTRVDVVNCENYGYYSEGSYPVTATIYNNAYGVATTYEPVTEEESTTASN